MKRFVDLKECDDVFIISDNKCYKRKFLGKTMKHIVDTVKNDDGSYKMIYGLTDEIDETQSNYGDYDIEITIENIVESGEPYKFSVNTINSTHYEYREWFYVFSDFESLRMYRDFIYVNSVEPWDNVIRKFENNELD